MLDSTLLNCFEKSVMPSLIFSLSLLFLKKDFSSASSFLIYCAFSIFFCVFFNKVPRAQCQLSSSNIQAGAELSMKEVKTPGSSGLPATNCTLYQQQLLQRRCSCGSLSYSPSNPSPVNSFSCSNFHLWSKPRGVFLRKMWRKSKSDGFSLYKWGVGGMGKVSLCQTHALTVSVTWKIAEAGKFVFGFFYSHPQLQVLLQCFIIISHVFARECLNFHLFFSVQVQILAISPSHTLMENSFWLKMHLEQSALWSSLCRTNVTLCCMAGQGLGIYCSDNRTAQGKKGQREKRPKRSPKTHFLKQKPSLSLSCSLFLLLKGSCEQIRIKHFAIWKTANSNIFPCSLEGMSVLLCVPLRCSRPHTFLVSFWSHKITLASNLTTQLTVRFLRD